MNDIRTIKASIIDRRVYVANLPKDEIVTAKHSIIVKAALGGKLHLARPRALCNQRMHISSVRAVSLAGIPDSLFCEHCFGPETISVVKSAMPA